MMHIRRGKDGTTKKVRTTTVEFDYLVVVCEPDLIYVIPSDALKSTTEQDIDALVRNFCIKPLETAGTRMDSQRAAERWEPYRNNFEQLAVVTK